MTDKPTLDDVMTPEQQAILISLLANLAHDKGWGNVKIVYCEGRITNMKLEQSYKV